MTERNRNSVCAPSADPAYEIKFQHADSYGWFYTRVFHGDDLIARKACCRSYRLAVWWAKRRIRDHRKALASVRGAVS